MFVLAAKLISVLYALCSLLPLGNKVTMFSRQGKSPSLDFAMLSSTLREQCPDVEVRLCVTSPESIDKKAFLMSLPVMVYHAATSRVCILEGYIPAVSIPKLREGTTVIQLWHALGAVKKFGFQSVGTAAGRSVDNARALSMHGNYDWIVAAGPGAVGAYSEAFGYDAARILPLGMPRMDYLLDKDEDAIRLRRAEEIRKRYSFMADARTRILYVPTMRQDRKGWMQQEVAKLTEALEPFECVLVVAGHPLETRELYEPDASVKYVPGVKSIDLLECADYVITDYSAIAFEAALVGKPVLFYVPDIDQYRESPGLNIDPIAMFPNEAFFDANALAEAIFSRRHFRSVTTPSGSFADFASRYLANVEEGSTQRLVAFVKECYRDTFRLDSANSNTFVDKGETTC